MSILSLKNVGLKYQTDEGETEAIANLNLEVYEGEFISLVGPSGCGKTTILSLIAGLIKATDGVVEVGENIRLGYMLQRDQLFEWRTILSNVLLGTEIQKQGGTSPVVYAKELLNKYGLGDFTERFPRHLSGGMRQRAALIRTLVLRPDILLLDEPFSALDYQTRLAVQNDVHSIIKAEKKTAILVTHDISEAVSMSERVIVLSSRPASVKSEFTLDFPPSLSPLQRRECAQFSGWFDRIWREIS